MTADSMVFPCIGISICTCECSPTFNYLLPEIVSKLSLLVSLLFGALVDTLIPTYQLNFLFLYHQGFLVYCIDFLFIRLLSDLISYNHSFGV